MRERLSTAAVWMRLAACVLVGAVIWNLPVPAGVTESGWGVFAVFVAAILGFLLRPLRMGPLVLVGLVVLSATNTLTPDTAARGDDFSRALTGFGNSTVWLVVAAFLIAGAVHRSGLGRRIALSMVKALGRSTLGLGYAACGAELVLGPFIPSNTARGGGLMAPIQSSLARALGSLPHDQPRRAGEYLMLVASHANLIAAAMFLTGMAGNVFVQQAAQDVLDLEFGWGTWALGSLVPGLVAMALLPLLIFRLAPPELRQAREARAKATEELAAMGAWTTRELVMGSVFLLMLVLWCTAFLHGMSSSLVAWLGVCVLLLTRTETWKDMSGEAGAWDALVWLGGLVSMADMLLDEGVIGWFAGEMQALVSGGSGIQVAVLLAVLYFYSMYSFSMLTGHISAMAGAFFAVGMAAGAPPLLMVGLIAYFSNLCGCLTNYSSGPVVIYFGLGYVPAPRWFFIGAVVSVFHMVVWLLVGGLWWKLLGWW